MERRGRLEIMRDILKIVQNNHKIKPTPLLRQSNISSSRFKEYFNEILNKKFIKEIKGNRDEKLIILTENGEKFLEKYKIIINFIEEFEL